jgi:mannose-1-phosphate guanylyltransferase
MLEFHKTHGREITMMVTSVEDPSKYGVVFANEDGRLLKFIEKPKDFIGNKVNAGLYIFNTSVIDKIELRPHFLERDLFPKLADEGNIYCLNLTGFWMDIG